MKKLLTTLLVSALLLTLGAGVTMAQGLGNAVHSPEDIVNDYPVSELNEEQIADLEEVMAAVPEDFKAVYANLKAGSENHLAAFDRVSNNERGNRGSQRGQNNQSGKGKMNKNTNNRLNRGGNRK